MTDSYRPITLEMAREFELSAPVAKCGRRARPKFEWSGHRCDVRLRAVLHGLILFCDSDSDSYPWDTYDKYAQCMNIGMKTAIH